MEKEKWFDEDIYLGEGIVSQLEKVNHLEPKPLNSKDFFKWWDDMSKKESERIRKRDKEVKQNIKHLLKRKEELKKEIPVELWLRVTSTYPLLVGTDFIKKYDEWLK